MSLEWSTSFSYEPGGLTLTCWTRRLSTPREAPLWLLASYQWGLLLQASLRNGECHRMALRLFC